MAVNDVTPGIVQGLPEIVADIDCIFGPGAHVAPRAVTQYYIHDWPFPSPLLVKGLDGVACPAQTVPLKGRLDSNYLYVVTKRTQVLADDIFEASSGEGWCHFKDSTNTVVYTYKAIDLREVVNKDNNLGIIRPDLGLVFSTDRNWIRKATLRSSKWKDVQENVRLKSPKELDRRNRRKLNRATFSCGVMIVVEPDDPRLSDKYYFNIAESTRGVYPTSSEDAGVDRLGVYYVDGTDASGLGYQGPLDEFIHNPDSPIAHGLEFFTSYTVAESMREVGARVAVMVSAQQRRAVIERGIVDERIHTNTLIASDTKVAEAKEQAKIKTDSIITKDVYETRSHARKDTSEGLSTTAKVMTGIAAVGASTAVILKQATALNAAAGTIATGGMLFGGALSVIALNKLTRGRIGSLCCGVVSTVWRGVCAIGNGIRWLFGF